MAKEEERDLLIVALGGGVGAVLRYWMGKTISKYNRTPFPIGTFLINAVGSFLLGVLAVHGPKEVVWLFWGVGFMGGFTTFSTFGYESILLLQQKKYKEMVSYVVCSTVLCTIFSYIGFSI